MNRRLQVSPLSDISQGPNPGGATHLPKHFQDVKLFRSWLVYPTPDLQRLSRRTNWDAALGLTIATVVSASFWVGLGLVVAHFWR